MLPEIQKPGDQDFAKILNGLPLAVAYATLEPDSRILFINESFTRFFGYTLEDIPRVADWGRLAYPDENYRRETFLRWDAAVAKAVESRGGVESMEFRVVCKNGEFKDVLLSAIVLEDHLLVSLVDITARRKAEAEARSAQEKLERTAYEVTENIPAGTYTMVLPPDGGMARFSFMSSRFLELCGLERQAAEENPFNAFACVHPDDYDEWVRKNAECFEKKIPFSEECRVIARGVERWILAESVPRELPDGSMVWEGVLTDITRRKLAERELAASESRLRKILDNIPIPVALNDRAPGERITFLNEAFTRMFGYTHGDLPDVGTWARLAYPDEAYRTATFETWDAAVAEAARTDGIVHPMEFRVAAKDGTRRDVIISAAVLDEKLLVAFVDITARRRAEEELRSAREKLERTAYELTVNIPVGTYVLEFDASGNPRFTFTSERWLGMLDLRRDAVLADPSLPFHAVHPDDREGFQQLNARVFAHKERFYWEGRIVVRGETRWVTIESIPRDHPNGGTVWEGVMIDITGRKTAEADLARARDLERQTEESHRRELEEKLRTSLTASAIAHEINQPLGRILLLSELVMTRSDGFSKLDKKLAGYLGNLVAEANEVVSTIGKMKALLRNVETRHTRVNLVDVVQDSLLYCGIPIRDRGAEIEFDEPARGLWISGDAYQLQLALNNLLRNALEALEPRPARQRRIRIDLARTRSETRLVVGDSGPGLSETEARRLLLKSTKPGGSGMGLFLVATAMENHGGRLEIARSPLGGAEFRLIFPLLHKGETAHRA